MRKSEILKTLRQQQETKVDQLKNYLTRVKEEAERALEKIDKEGPEGYYSCNSPLQEWVNSAWKTSLALSELRGIQTRFEEKELRKKLKAKRQP